MDNAGRVLIEQGKITIPSVWKEPEECWQQYRAHRASHRLMPALRQGKIRFEG